MSEDEFQSEINQIQSDLSVYSDTEKTIVNFQTSPQTFVDEFYRTITQRFGNTMVDIGVFQGILSENNLRQIIHDIASKTSKDTEQIAIVAIATIPKQQILSTERIEQEGSCETENLLLEEEKEELDTLEDSIPDLLNKLYNKRLEITAWKTYDELTEQEKEKERLLYKQICIGWEIHSKDEIIENVKRNSELTREMKLQIKKQLRRENKKFNEWKLNCVPLFN